MGGDSAPALRKFPVFSLLNREFGPRDGFARDWPLRHHKLLFSLIFLSLGVDSNWCRVSAALRRAHRAARSAETAFRPPLRGDCRPYLCSRLLQYRARNDADRAPMPAAMRISRRETAGLAMNSQCRSRTPVPAQLGSWRIQAKPSLRRCSGQASGRREWASSFCAVRSRGWRPSRIARVMSGAR